ncbi:MAG: flagellar hook-basal body complex protein, partial [Gammaproteobacteria bacterium]|nr:flagellar hook-basal body complex protein [Gammaproteobacteria bacterium]
VRIAATVWSRSSRFTRTATACSTSAEGRWPSGARNRDAWRAAASFDMAFEGRGFFEIQLPDGTQAYTRDGTFQQNQDGQLVTSSGYELQPGISIPTGAIGVTIGADGVVSAVLPGSPGPIQVGSIQLVDFLNAGGLQPRGENLYIETIASGPPQSGTPGQNGLGTLAQGALETSNVNVVEEFVNMIESQRAYEMNSRAISTSDEMLRFVTNNL